MALQTGHVSSSALTRSMNRSTKVIDKMRNEALIILVGKGPAARYIRNCESSDN